MPQFHHIDTGVTEQPAAEQVVSSDTSQNELVGDSMNIGRERHRSECWRSLGAGAAIQAASKRARWFRSSGITPFPFLAHSMRRPAYPEHAQPSKDDKITRTSLIKIAAYPQAGCVSCSAALPDTALFASLARCSQPSVP
jgi:hypothetical protein